MQFEQMAGLPGALASKVFYLDGASVILMELHWVLFCWLAFAFFFSLLTPIPFLGKGSSNARPRPIIALHYHTFNKHNPGTSWDPSSNICRESGITVLTLNFIPYVLILYIIYIQTTPARSPPYFSIFFVHPMYIHYVGNQLLLLLLLLLGKSNIKSYPGGVSGLILS